MHRFQQKYQNALTRTENKLFSKNRVGVGLGVGVSVGVGVGVGKPLLGQKIISYFGRI